MAAESHGDESPGLQSVEPEAQQSVAGAPQEPPLAGGPAVYPPDEEEEDFEAADADEDEQEDVDEQAREETV
jgi:hypothetical protein